MKDRVIIKKKYKRNKHGASHSGSWKVAYADFVTAMMAFFLLLWLLAATPAENLQGLADYFSPTTGLSDRMGIGFKGGKAVVPEGVSTEDWADKGVIYGAPPSGPMPKMKEKNISSGDGGRSSDADRFSLIQTTIQNNFANQSELLEHIDFKVDSKGLNIEIRDKKNKPMFTPGSFKLTKKMNDIIKVISNNIKYLPNYIEITGHTNSIRFIGSKYTNWELSADRANAIRRRMLSFDVDEKQIISIIGKGNREPINRINESSPENRRVNIQILNRGIIPEYKKALPQNILGN